MTEIDSGLDIAMTPAALMRARGASEKEIQDYLKRQEKKLRLSLKK